MKYGEFKKSGLVTSLPSIIAALDIIINNRTPIRI